ncbi:MAG: monovalent cation/H(+) antiporter subunit G [Acidobacteria bacterium]|nr:monovalent cation/H(+) antiporter subunit G [Acidobacteriota bacterium]
MAASTLTEGFAILLVAAGLFFILAAVIGILRLPDFFTRLHAMGKCDTAGLSLSLLGLALLADDLAVTVKLVLVLALVAVANRTATLALARAASRAGVKVWRPDEPAGPAGER